MNELKMPKKGESARMLAQLQAEHAAEPPTEELDDSDGATHVTTLQATPAATGAGSPADANEGTNVATGVATLAPVHTPTPEATEDERSIEGSVARRERATPASIPGAPRPRRSSERDDRLAHALRRGAEDEITVVTVRVSASLNRYMDDYTARVNRIDPKRKYRKQDAVLEAFAAFYADHPMPPAPEEEAL